MKQTKSFTRILKLIETEFERCTTIDEKVNLLNTLNKKLTSLSPFEDPVDCVLWVKGDKVCANEYNPNIVAPPEMELLYLSVKLDKFTQPIVCYPIDSTNFEVVDGFHRNRVGKEYEDIKEEHHGYLPIVVIDKPLDERMGSTIRHNRARGSHQIRGMSDLVTNLIRQGWSDEIISEKLGMELDEVIRLKQISGLKDAFASHQFSRSWEDFEKKYYDDESGDI